jgi:hypothetical protein
MAETLATPEAQAARQGVEAFAWQTGKTAVEIGAKVREGRSLLERLGLRREVVEKASPTVTELAAKATEGLGKLATKAGESLRRRGEQRLERGKQWAERQLTSQQKEDEKALDEKAKLSREAQIRATGEEEVSRRVSTEIKIIGRENILQEALNSTQEALRRLQERFMGWRANVNTYVGQKMIDRGLDIGNAGEILLTLPEKLRVGWDSKKTETLQAIDTQLQPLEERVEAGKRIQKSLEDAFTRVVGGGPFTVQVARDMIASLRPEDIAGQEEELRKMINRLASLAGAGQQPQSPLEQARNY